MHIVAVWVISMNVVNLIAISVAVSLDAFAVAIGKGLSLERKSVSKALLVGTLFGIFQMMMTLVGFFLGKSCASFIEITAHWLAFLLLGVVGVNMILEGFRNETDETGWRLPTLLVLSLATSLDAFSVGITLAFLKTQILITSIVIGLITFVLCFIGVLLGHKLGTKLQVGATFFGGLILILIGCYILLEHFGWF